MGFEFERYGARYDHFDLSTDGFVAFGSDAVSRLRRAMRVGSETDGRGTSAEAG